MLPKLINYNYRIDVDATLENINNISTVKILVKFPDGTHKLFHIDSSHFVPVQPFTFKVKSVPLILHINKATWPKGNFLKI